MSTILEAQRELERRRAGQMDLPVPASPDTADRARWPLVAGAVTCIAIGVGVLVVMLRTPARPPAAPGRPAPADASARAAVATPPRRVAGSGQPVSGSMSGDPTVDAPPWGRIEKQAVATPVATAPVVVNRSAAGRPDRRPDAPPTPRRAAVAAAAPPQRVEDAGHAGVRVKAIHFDKVASERSVTLVLDGGRELTLRQGQEAAGIAVQLILPSMAYVQQGSSVFAVSLVR